MANKKHTQTAMDTAFPHKERKENTIIVDTQNRVAIQKWSKDSTFEEFIELINKTLVLIKDNTIDKVISDAKIQSPLKKEQVDYATKALELYFEEGLEKIALITPQSIFNEILVSDFIQNANVDKIKSFTTMNEAQNWLIEAKNIN